MNSIAQKFTNPVVGETLKGYESGSPDQFLVKFLPNVVGLILIIGAVAFFFMLLWGATMWILSGGDKASVESSRNKITHAILGFVLLIATFAVIALVESFFDINILSIDIGPLFIK